MTVEAAGLRHLKRLRALDERLLSTYACAVVLVVAGIFLMVKARGNTFFYDEWRWLVLRRSGFTTMLGAYNNHMLIGATALYQLLFRTVGLAHFWVYRLLGTIAHLLLAAAVFVYARRRIGSAALLLVLPFVVLGYGWEYVIWPINVGFISSVSLGVCALLVLDRAGSLGGRLALVLLIAGLLCSEFTVVFAVGIAVELSWKDRSLRRAYVWAIPLVLYAAWWLGYHQPAASVQLDTVPTFAANLAAAATGGLLGLDINWGRPLLLGLLCLIGWRLSRPGGFTPRAAAVLVIAAAFWLLVAYGRASGGDPTAPRYVYTGSALIMLVLAETLRGLPFRLPALAVGTVIAVFAVSGNLAELSLGEDSLRVASSVARSELGALQLARPFVSPAMLIDPHYMPGITAGGYLAAIQSLGSTPADDAAQIAHESETGREAADKLLIRARALQVAPPLGLTAGPSGAAPSVEVAANGGVTRDAHCVTFHSRGAGAALAVALPQAGLELHARPGPGVKVYARSYASVFGPNLLTTLTGGHTIDVRPRATTPSLAWSLQLSPNQTVSACGAG